MNIYIFEDISGFISRIWIKMRAISNFCTVLSAQNLNTPIDKVLKIEENVDNTTMVSIKNSVENLHKSTKELFSGK